MVGWQEEEEKEGQWAIGSGQWGRGREEKIFERRGRKGYAEAQRRKEGGGKRREKTEPLGSVFLYLDFESWLRVAVEWG